MNQCPDEGFADLVFTSDNAQLSQPKTNVAEAEICAQSKPIQNQCADGYSGGGSIGRYLAAAVADNTRRAYRSDLADFLTYGGVVPCSPEFLARYISDRADTNSPATITRRAVGIGRAHVTLGHADPSKSDLVRAVLRGVRRTKGVSQRQAAPLLPEHLFAAMPLMRGVIGARDRALILLGFASAMRRSELVALDLTDIEFVNEGLVITLRRSKTDQIGDGRKIGIPHGRTTACPVKALLTWLELGAITIGPIFRPVGKSSAVGSRRLSAQAVNLVVKKHIAQIGLPPAGYSGHSLRAGLVTSAARAGVSTHKILAQSGHRSEAMLARYIRDAAIFDQNAAGALL